MPINQNIMVNPFLFCIFLSDMGKNSGDELNLIVLKSLAQLSSPAIERNGVDRSYRPCDEFRREGGVFLASNELSEYCELLIKNAGGVRALARLGNINSGHVTMARNGYYSPAYLETFGLLKNPRRRRWITDTDLKTFGRVENARKLAGLSRRKALRLFADYIEKYAAAVQNQ